MPGRVTGRHYYTTIGLMAQSDRGVRLPAAPFLDIPTVAMQAICRLTLSP